MKKVWLGVATLSLGMLSSSLLAAPGEWWELSTKAEMPGMPFAMPAQTQKVCMAKGSEADPRQTQGKDGNCKISDMQHSGNTVKFKGTCVNDGETMNMVGEMTHDGSSFKNIMKMTGRSHGEPINMAMTSTGKRIGGACDTQDRDERLKKLDDQAKQVEVKLEKNRVATCERSNTYNASEWVVNSAMFVGKGAMCPENREKLCNVVRNDAMQDFKLFAKLTLHGNSADISKECNVNIAAIAKTKCKSRALKGPQHFLDKYCPSEAKSYRELMRKLDACSGRGYTAHSDEMKKCMNGTMPENDESDEEMNASDSSSSGSDSGSGSRSGDSISTDSVLQGAKKLKGLFGF